MQEIYDVLIINFRYSWVNFAIFDSDDVCVFGKPDENWKREMRTGVGRSFKAFPGLYLMHDFKLESFYSKHRIIRLQKYDERVSKHQSLTQIMRNTTKA